MYLRTLLMLLVLGALALFALENWNAFTTPTSLSLIFATIEAPLGLILLGTVAVLTLLFLLYVVYLQSSVLFESRRHARDLQAQRELAEHAESSRLSELRSYLESEMERLAKESEQSTMDVTSRMDRLEGDLRAAMTQTETTLAAYLGEIDDRLERRVAELPPPKPV
ncbi:MAG: LapA family protein [Deltaproteobacteria bacterium]|nr:LapA family protein [Deltaproteobacteria bacterium]